MQTWWIHFMLECNDISPAWSLMFQSVWWPESVHLSLVLPRAFSYTLSGIKHNSFSRRWLLPSPSLVGSQTWVSSTTRGRRLTFEDSLYYPIQWVESKDRATWELIWGLGYSGSSFSSCLSLSSDNLLYREDFPLVWST